MATTERVSSYKHQQNAFQLISLHATTTTNREMSERAYAVPQHPSGLLVL